MKTINEACAQGELYITRVEALPPGVTKAGTPPDFLVVGHSESGHHHVMDPTRTTLYRLPEEIYELFLVVGEGGDTLTHLRPTDTHEPIFFPQGTYRVRRQREYTPEGLRSVVD